MAWLPVTSPITIMTYKPRFRCSTGVNAQYYIWPCCGDIFSNACASFLYKSTPFTSIPPMQTQQIRTATKSITHTQSLTVVKTLLQAGLGAITYLRFFHFSGSCCMHRLILSSKKFTTRRQLFFTFIFLSHISQLITDHELDHLNTVTSEDAILTKTSDNSVSPEASQTSIDSRKHANRFRIMVPLS